MSFEVGDVILLEGKSQKGKNRVHEFGPEWVVLVVRNDLSLSQPCGNGPFALVQPVGGSEIKARWVASRNDPNFEMEKSDGNC